MGSLRKGARLKGDEQMSRRRNGTSGPSIVVAVRGQKVHKKPAYGAPVDIANAKKAAAAALAEARKNNWNMAVAVVDIAGNLVYFEKMDDTMIGSVNVAQD